MKKTLTLFLTLIITIAFVCLLVKYIKMDGFAFAWSLNFILMFGTLAFTETLQSRLSSSYYHEKGWEKSGKIYERLGINAYRKLLVWIGWEKLGKKSNPVKKTTEALNSLYYQTKKAELGHLIILIIVLCFNFLVAFKFGAVKSLWLLSLNLLLNLYPIFLQRYNRPRIQKAIALSMRRNEKKAAISA